MRNEIVNWLKDIFMKSWDSWIVVLEVFIGQKNKNFVGHNMKFCNKHKFHSKKITKLIKENFYVRFTFVNLFVSFTNKFLLRYCQIVLKTLFKDVIEKPHMNLLMLFTIKIDKKVQKVLLVSNLTLKYSKFLFPRALFVKDVKRKYNMCSDHLWTYFSNNPTSLQHFQRS